MLRLEAELTPEENALPESWSDPASALSAVKALREHLEKDPEDLGFISETSSRHWPEALNEELKYCQETLENAVRNGLKFRLLIIP